jgi:Sec-independent protein secretion pathway component TatC
MTLAEHLAEVRHRFLISTITVSLFGVLAFIFYPQILHLLQEPYCAARDAAHKTCVFLVTNPLDGLTLRIKIASSAEFSSPHRCSFGSCGVSSLRG